MIAGIDYSTHAVDVVLLEEDTDRATWHRFVLEGTDAFDRARDVRRAMHDAIPLWDDVLGAGIEDPRGHNAGALYRVQGAILSRLPPMLLVQPWVPSAWRKQVGLPGNAPKVAVRVFASTRYWAARPTIRARGDWYVAETPEWPQDAWDAYLIALATRQQLHRTEAA